MKKFLLMTCAILLFATPHSASAAVSGAPLPKGNEPILITNAGQGPGGKMGRLLVSRAGAVAEAPYDAEPLPETLAAGGHKTIFVVIGSSAKGLGASGITIDQEVDRLNKLMTKAKELNIQILALHIEGKARRGKPGSADERSIDVILPFADHIIVAKEGDDVDQKFTNFGKANTIPVTYLDTTLDLVEAVKAMYAK